MEAKIDGFPLKQLQPAKFSNPQFTASGEMRATVDFVELRTLWFNTGTLCNLKCKHCYIESSPRNDRLVYLDTNDVCSYLDEIGRLNLPTEEIGFTGGEPFMNPDAINIIRSTLLRGFHVLVLTNAMRPMMKLETPLLELRSQFGKSLSLRVSLDHHTQSLHDSERGDGSWEAALTGLQWLTNNDFSVSVAGRTLWNLNESTIRRDFANLFAEKRLSIDAYNSSELVIFPEMNPNDDVPEITTACWKTLNQNPANLMCANSRMVIKRSGDDKPHVIACTLLPYDTQFSISESLADAHRSITLNHPNCSKFCVLGGGSCSTRRDRAPSKQQSP